MKSLIILMMVSGIISFFLTPFVRKFAEKINAMDVPKDDRRMHKKPIPLLGGLAILISFSLTLILKPGPLKTYEIGIIIGAIVISVGGFIDDVYVLKPWQKIIFQLAAAIVLILYNVRITNITNPFSTLNTYLGTGFLSIPLTIVWVIGLTNALNLIDGLDGLCAGIAGISCITILIIAILNKRWEAAVLTSILIGSIYGFLPYNFNPASIFIGDTGSQLLGFLLAAISMEGTIKSAAAFAIVVPILAIGLPIYDTLFAIIRRKVNGKPIMQGDKGHLHHRLIQMGLSQKQAVIIMYFISAVLGGISIIAMQISNQRAYFLLAIVIVVSVFAAWKCGFFKSKD